MPHYIETNYDGTQILLEQSVVFNISVFVFASTSSVYGRTNRIPFVETDPSDKPLSPYAATKRAAEILCHVYHNLHGLNVTILRLFNVYGPRGRPDMMPAQLLLASIDQTLTIDIFDNGTMMRDWTYIDDVVTAFIKALDKPLGYETVNIGAGHPVTLTMLIKHIERLSGNSKIWQNARFRHAQAAEPPITYANISKARRLLEFEPRVSLFSGLSKTWHWFINEQDPFGKRINGLRNPYLQFFKPVFSEGTRKSYGTTL